jgi:hypothetical protein
MRTFHFMSFLAALCIGAGMLWSCAADDDDDKGDDDADAASTVWTDHNTGLKWQNGEDVGLEEFTWQQAIDHCQTLDWGGYTDWRLPTISELRSLIRGCTPTVTGGQCGVTDSCLNHNNCWNDLCNGCEDYAGPGTNGLYWPNELTGQCCFYWSASLVEPDNTGAWDVHFDGGLIGTDGVGFHIAARCVRD